MREIRRIEASGKVPPMIALFTAATKPVEELYDLEQDPHELNNLVDKLEYQSLLGQMREACRRWQFEIRDIGLVPESEIEIREGSVGARYNILRSGQGECPDGEPSDGSDG